MKKIRLIVFSLLLSMLMAVQVLAAEPDLARAGSEDMEAFAAEAASGRHLFDTIGALTDAEAQDLEDGLREIEESYGQSAVIVITENNSISTDLEEYAEYIYGNGGLGTGADRDGVLLVLDLGDDAHRGVQIFAQSGAALYFTDSAIEEILYERYGGLMDCLSEGLWYQALDRYVSSTEDLYGQGIQPDQYSFYEDTGETEYYYTEQVKEEGRRFKIWYVPVALIIAFFAGFFTVRSVKDSYAMKREKREAQKVSLAYRQASSFAFSVTNDALIGTHMIHVPVPRHSDSGSGGFGSSGGSGFGGGMSTMHSSGFGGHHTSGGAKF